MRTRISRATLVGALAALPACASSAGSTAREGPVILVLDEREARLSAALGRHVSVDQRPISDSLPAVPARAYQALVTAYSGLGVREVVSNPETGLIAIAEHRARGTIAGQRPSRFVSCGTTLTGARADEDLLVVSVVSRIKPVGADASIVETHVVATATDARGSGYRQACTSTGQLELRLHEAAKAALGS